MNTTEWDVLVVDLDGTLLCKQGEVSEQNLHALDSVRELGIEVIVATGRSFRECKHIVERMGHYGVCITASGSQLTTHEGQGITRSVVGSSVVEQVTNTVNAKGHRALLLKDDSACGMPYVLVGDSPLHEASTWWFESLHIPFLEVPLIEDDPYPEHTLRVGAVADASVLVPIANALEQQLRGKAKIQHWSAVTCSEATGSNIHLLEVFGESVNKWSMLEKHLGSSILPERIVAIGDGLNDIEVLKEAGLSIVMENADENVRAHADVFADHHDNDGFASAMTRWVLPEGRAE